MGMGLPKASFSLGTGAGCKDEGVAFNPLTGLIWRQSAVLKAADWDCFPRMSP